jgi:hypothetical protein
MSIIKTSAAMKREKEARKAASSGATSNVAGGAANTFQTVDHFIMIFKLVLNRPCITQSIMTKATRLSKAKVSKLCAQGVTTGLFEKRGREYIPGPVLKSYGNSYLNINI